MSASTIARWNAIRDPNTIPSNKRYRSDDDGDDSSEDNVSIVSRSPSPQPERDVDMKDTYAYDEHVRGTAREVITVETKLKSTNKGFSMLAKMGWTEGSPLGLSGDGRVDPIPFTVKQDSTGLGKVTQDFRMIETTVSQRRNLESERMQFETAEQRQQREAAAVQKAVVQSEISSTLRAFYCELCDKQFKTVAQYDEHTNSYAHHHRARARDMNANHPVRAGGREEAERRKEKERKREEKELRKIAKAAGIKITAPPVANQAAGSAAAGENKGFKKSSWATVGDGPTPSTSTSTSVVAATPSPGGWATTSAPPPPSTAPPPPPPPPASVPAPPPPAAPSHGGFRSGGWSTLPTSSNESPSTTRKGGGGWASIDSHAVPPSPLPPPEPLDLPPATSPSSSLQQPSDPPPPPPTPSSWNRLPLASSSNSQSSHSSDGRWGAKPSTEDSFGHLPPPPSAHSQTQHNPNPTLKPKLKLAFDSAAPTQSRGNWQSFQKMRGRR